MSWEKQAINKVPFMAFDASEHHISHSELRVLGVAGTGLGSSDRPRVPIGATRTQSPSSLRYSRRSCRWKVTFSTFAAVATEVDRSHTPFTAASQCPSM
jgi:hypothetical protein